jgi:uncharacterized protein with ParB-like and HNH nuclease domain
MDDEILVFESINSKGKSLSILDLIKNYFFLNLVKTNSKEDNEADVDKLFSTKISNMFKGSNNGIDEKLMLRFFTAILIISDGK